MGLRILRSRRTKTSRQEKIVRQETARTVTQSVNGLETTATGHLLLTDYTGQRGHILRAIVPDSRILSKKPLA